MWVNERLPGFHRGLGGGQEGPRGSIHNILQIEFDLDRPRGRVWPAENCGRVHSKSYWSGRLRGGGGWGGRRVRRPRRGASARGKQARRAGALEGVMESRGYGAGGVILRGEETEVVPVYHLQSGGHPLLSVIIFKRLHPQSISLMAVLFGQHQFYSLIRALQTFSPRVPMHVRSHTMERWSWISK